MQLKSFCFFKRLKTFINFIGTIMFIPEPLEHGQMAISSYSLTNRQDRQHADYRPQFPISSSVKEMLDCINNQALAVIDSKYMPPARPHVAIIETKGLMDGDPERINAEFYAGQRSLRSVLFDELVDLRYKSLDYLREDDAKLLALVRTQNEWRIHLLNELQVLTPQPVDKFGIEQEIAFAEAGQPKVLLQKKIDREIVNAKDASERIAQEKETLAVSNQKLKKLRSELKRVSTSTSPAAPKAPEVA